MHLTELTLSAPWEHHWKGRFRGFLRTTVTTLRPVEAARRTEDDAMIVASGLRKRYGDKTAVDDLSFQVRPGVVTGFLGPNGAGKSTTMRLMLDLDYGDGQTRFDGRRFRDIRHPLREIGTVLEARAFHPTRSARNHLRTSRPVRVSAARRPRLRPSRPVPCRRRR